MFLYKQLKLYRCQEELQLTSSSKLLVWPPKNKNKNKKEKGHFMLQTVVFQQKIHTKFSFHTLNQTI